MSNHQWLWASILGNDIINLKKKYGGKKGQGDRKTMGLTLGIFKMAVEYLGEI